MAHLDKRLTLSREVPDTTPYNASQTPLETDFTANISFEANPRIEYRIEWIQIHSNVKRTYRKWIASIG